MRLTTTVLALAMASTTTPATAQDAKPVTQSVSAPKSAVAASLDPYVANGQLGGYVTLLMQEGKVIDRQIAGNADIPTRTPMRADTIFRAYSMTKPVTGAALMILHDRGRWKLDDPVAKYLPELANLRVYRGTDASGRMITSPAATQPTMRQLVTHTAGFLYGFGDTPVDREYQKHIPLVPTYVGAATYLRDLAAIPLAYDPGTQWQYSVGMDLEGLIVERLSGMPLQTFMQREIFDPLKMKDTGFLVPEGKRSRFATLYEYKEGALRKVTTGPFAHSYADQPVQASGGGGLVTTAGDYARFASMLLGRGTLDGARVLSPAAVRTIMSSHLSPKLLAGGYGIGFQKFRPGFEFGVNGVVVTDARKAGVTLGDGSYFWDGAAGTWFWVDPTNRVVFVGMIQRLTAGDSPNLEAVTQRAVASVLTR